MDFANIAPWARIASFTIGGALLAQAVIRRSPGNVLLAIAGAEMIRAGFAQGRPSRIPFPQVPPQNIVDLASELSFPASDPPAY